MSEILAILLLLIPFNIWFNPTEIICLYNALLFPRSKWMSFPLTRKFPSLSSCGHLFVTLHSFLFPAIVVFCGSITNHHKPWVFKKIYITISVSQESNQIIFGSFVRGSEGCSARVEKAGVFVCLFVLVFYLEPGDLS